MTNIGFAGEVGEKTRTISRHEPGRANFKSMGDHVVVVARRRKRAPDGDD